MKGMKLQVYEGNVYSRKTRMLSRLSIFRAKTQEIDPRRLYFNCALGSDRSFVPHHQSPCFPFLQILNLFGSTLLIMMTFESIYLKLRVD